jgi:hypothetical protein
VAPSEGSPYIVRLLHPACRHLRLTRSSSCFSLWIVQCLQRRLKCQHTPAYASIRQHTPAYASIHQHRLTKSSSCFSLWIVQCLQRRLSVRTHETHAIKEAKKKKLASQRFEAPQGGHTLNAWCRESICDSATEGCLHTRRPLFCP